jgi:hypothetical protein
MQRFGRGVWVVVLFLGLASGGGTEEAPEVVRVRVLATEHRKAIVGRLVGADGVSLRIERSGPKELTETVVVSRSSVTRFEMSRGKSWKSRGALLGSLVGVGTGAVILAGREEGIASCLPPPGWGVVGMGRPLPPCTVGGDGSRWAAAILAVPAGALLGYLVSPGEQWEAADPAKLHMAAALARRGGAQVTLSLSF